MSDFPSIAETGAKPGDTVICVRLTDAPSYRFTEGRHYRVVDFSGGVAVHGNSDFGSKPGVPAWLIPWRGYGAMWRLVEA